MAIKCVRPTAEVFYGLAFFIFGFNAITLPQIIQHKVCYNKYNSSICSRLKNHPVIENDVQATAASWMSVIPLSALVPSLFTVLMIGPISDVIGKKRMMIVPPTVYLVQSLIFMALAGIEDKFSPGYFFFGYCITALFGDNSGCVLLSQAYISCITTSQDRTVRLALLESSLFIGGLVAAISSGFILSYFGFIGGFAATGIVNLINLIYVVFFLPHENALAHCPDPTVTSKETGNPTLEYKERSQINKKGNTVSKDKEHVSDDESIMKNMNPVACLRRISNAICRSDRRNRILAILVLFSLALFINMGEAYMGVLFLKHSPFSLGFKDIGYLLALQGFLRAFGLATIPYLFQVLFGFKDISIVMVGFCTQICYFLSLGFSTSRTMLYCVQLIGIPAGIHVAVLRSMVSKMVDADQYGASTAALEVVDVASSLLTNFLSNLIYFATVRIFTGFAIVLLGMIAIPGLIGSVIFSRVYKDREVLNDEQKRLLGSCKSEEETEFSCD